MELVKGARIKLSSLRPELIVVTDWLGEREPAKGDIAVIEDVRSTNKGKMIRLLCEPKSGYLEWRIDIYEGGFEYELL